MHITNNWRNLALTLAIVIGYSFGIYFYCRGFLLNRHVIAVNNTCSVHIQHSQNDSDQFCMMKARYRRAIWIVIDGLRYDFMFPRSPPEPISEYYHNKLTVIADLLSQRPQNSILYKFVADPPTTTLQRLKGLTTGSLPTFVDAGSNFGASAIDEDNLINQMVAQGRRISFLGDDTWVSLFPRQFVRSLHFPSFDITDLHTVDDGILRHLDEELADKEWRFLIAHFLGVDHCGHKYGPNHPEMSGKLEQMNNMIRNVVERMDEETVLFVFGDHGMTQSGDHGGDSTDETHSSLFAYSHSELHREKTNILGATHQIDIVPTVSLLLDVPIPFSNLGKLLVELFPDPDSRSRAAKLNVEQVVHYTDTYLANFQDDLLKEKFLPVTTGFYDLEPEELTVENSLSFMTRISKLFVECWAKFHVGWMALGVLTIFENLLWSLSFLVENTNVIGRRIILKLAAFILSFLVVFARYEEIPAMNGVFAGCLIVWHLHALFNAFSRQAQTFDKSFWLLIALLVTHGASQFSNSFIVYDNRVAQFFVVSVLLAFLLSRLPQERTYARRAIDQRRKPDWDLITCVKQRVSPNLLVFAVLALTTLRLGQLSQRCREEQTPCIPSAFTVPFASLFDPNVKFFRAFTSLVALWAVFLLPKWFLRRNGHLSTESALRYILEYGGLIFTCSVTALWLLQWLPEHQMRKSWSLYPPLLCYAIFVAFALMYFTDPVLLNVERKTSIPPPPVVTNGDASERIRQAYQYLKSNYRLLGQAEQQTLYVFGAATGLSGPLVGVWLMFALLACLLLGDGFAFSVLAYTVVATVFLQISLNAGFNSVVFFVIGLHELSNHFFYASGHQPTLDSIPWEAAFIGIPGNFRFHIIPATLVILHISIGKLLAAIPLALFASWGRVKRKLSTFSSISESKKDTKPVETETELLQSDAGYMDSILRLNLSYLSAAAVGMLFSTAASAMHRRHLMAWKIFAPKFIFEGVQFLVTCVALLIQYLMVWRLHSLFRKKIASL